MKRTGSIVALLLGAGLAAACAPVIRSHGYTPVPEALERIQPGIDTKSSVQTKIGRPSSTGTFDDAGWYYVSTTVEHYTYNQPKVIERKVVAVTFDASDVVEAVDILGLEDGRIVDLKTGTTPTYGRQLTIVEQLLGNIGNLGPGSVFDDSGN